MLLLHDTMKMLDMQFDYERTQWEKYKFILTAIYIL